MCRAGLQDASKIVPVLEMRRTPHYKAIPELGLKLTFNLIHVQNGF